MPLRIRDLSNRNATVDTGAKIEVDTAVGGSGNGYVSSRGLAAILGIQRVATASTANAGSPALSTNVNRIVWNEADSMLIYSDGTTWRKISDGSAATT